MTAASASLARLPIVGVMGAHAEPWKDYAAPLGEHLARRAVHLLTGGGAGTMAAVAKAFCRVPGRAGVSIGILPAVPHPVHGYAPMEGYPNPWVEVPVVTPLGVYRGGDDGHITRNHVNILSADAVVALPGSVGTHNEIRLARRFAKKIVLFGPAEEFSVYDGGLPVAAALADVAVFLDAALAK
jgi:uncharacterized protein (TIGR00725 family)